MNARDILVIGVAAGAGFVGALPARYTPALAADQRQTIRATRVELLDEAGKVCAFLGFNERKELVLSFVQDGRERATLGMMSGDYPFIRLASARGEHRASIFVRDDKPALVMSDSRLEGRIRLGAVSYDAPSERDDDWALTFNGTGSRGPLATIGIVSGEGGQHGFIRIQDAQAFVWPR